MRGPTSCAFAAAGSVIVRRTAGTPVGAGCSRALGVRPHVRPLRAQGAQPVVVYKFYASSAADQHVQSGAAGRAAPAASSSSPYPVVLITGASQGVGREVSKLFAEKGYNVVMSARTEGRLAEAAGEVERGLRAQREVLAVAADVGDMEQVRGVVERAVERFGRIDAVVANAGVCITGPAGESTGEDWRRVMDTNLYGTVWATTLALPHLARSSDPRRGLVAVGSFGAKMPLANMSVYCASKYAMRGYIDTIRLELAPQGIHVGLVHPGVIKSDFLERAVFRGASGERAAAAMQQMLSSDSWNPLVQTPAQIAEAVWECLAERRDEVNVGGAKVLTEAYRLAPGLVGGLLKGAAAAADKP